MKDRIQTVECKLDKSDVSFSGLLNESESERILCIS